MAEVTTPPKVESSIRQVETPTSGYQSVLKQLEGAPTPTATITEAANLPITPDFAPPTPPAAPETPPTASETPAAPAPAAPETPKKEPTEPAAKAEGATPPPPPETPTATKEASPEPEKPATMETPAAKPAETPTAEKPTEIPTTETTPPERLNELQNKIDNNAITPDEYRKYQTLKKQDALREKVRNGTATNAEFKQWQELNKPKSAEAGEQAAEKKPTAEERLDDINKKVEGGEMGHFEGLWEVAKVIQEERAAGKPTLEQFKKAAENMIKKGGGAENGFIADFIYNQLEKIQEEMLDLAQLEAMLATAPKTLQELRQKRQEAQERVQKIKDAPEPTDPEERQKWAQEKYEARSALVGVSRAVIDAVYQINVNGAKMAELEAKIDKKLGVTKGVALIWEPLKTTCRRMYAEAAFDLKAMAEMPEMFI